MPKCGHFSGKEVKTGFEIGKFKKRSKFLVY
jgi:hypothetical protein